VASGGDNRLLGQRTDLKKVGTVSSMCRKSVRSNSAAMALCLMVVAVMAFRGLNAATPPADTRSTAGQSGPGAPVNVIFDTDIMSDLDDALALAMLQALHARHEANLVAVTISTDDKWCASYVDLVDTFYGHSDIPVGIVHDGVNLRKSKPDLIPREPNYTQVLSERRRSDGSLVYPHRLTDGSKAQDAVALLRKTLAGLPDNSVVMIQVGFSTNYARLLDSKPDGVSPQSGRDLIVKKVRMLSVMAGGYADANVDGKVLPKGSPEFNMAMDVPSAQRLFSAWPTPIVASGVEVGVSMLFPGTAVDRYFSYAPDHPIADAYRTYASWVKATWPHDHATFDLTSVLYAVRPNEDYFALSKPGTITVLPEGKSRFDESEAGRHRYLVLSDGERARVLEAMVMLASEPPRRVGKLARPELADRSAAGIVPGEVPLRAAGRAQERKVN